MHPNRPRADLSSTFRTRLRAQCRAAGPAAAGPTAALALLALAALAPCVLASGLDPGAALELGFDSFFQSFTLTDELLLEGTTPGDLIGSNSALRDTTDVFTEARAQLELSLAGTGRQHRWQARTRLSAGTDLYRESLALQYRWRPVERPTRADLSLDVEGRQFRADSDFSLSSNYGRIQQQAQLRREVSTRWEVGVRERLDATNFRRRSTFEQDQTRMDFSLTAAAHTDRVAADLESGGGFRDVPDSSAISYQRGWATADVSLQLSERWRLDLPGRVERRVYQNPRARSPFWDAIVEPVLRADLSPRWELELRTSHQALFYDVEDTAQVYYDLWAGRVGVRATHAGGALRVGVEPRWTWLASPRSVEEKYREPSVLLQVEWFSAGHVWVSVSQEVGRRFYGHSGDELSIYSDYTFLRSTLVGSVQLRPQVSLHAFVSDEPESHARAQDDNRLTLANLALRVEF